MKVPRKGIRTGVERDASSVPADHDHDEYVPDMDLPTLLAQVIVTIAVLFLFGIFAVYIVVSLSGCFGGGGGWTPPAAIDNTHLLVAWTQPPFRTDNTRLDLTRDIKTYEIVSYDNVESLAPWQGRAFPDNVVRFDYPLVIAIVSGVDNAGIPVQAIAIDLTRQAGIVLPDNVFITVRSSTPDNTFSAFAQGMYPEEGQ